MPTLADAVLALVITGALGRAVDNNVPIAEASASVAPTTFDNCTVNCFEVVAAWFGMATAMVFTFSPAAKLSVPEAVV